MSYMPCILASSHKLKPGTWPVICVLWSKAWIYLIASCPDWESSPHEVSWATKFYTKFFIPHGIYLRTVELLLVVSLLSSPGSEKNGNHSTTHAWGAKFAIVLSLAGYIQFHAFLIHFKLLALSLVLVLLALFYVGSCYTIYVYKLQNTNNGTVQRLIEKKMQPFNSKSSSTHADLLLLWW